VAKEGNNDKEHGRATLVVRVANCLEPRFVTHFIHQANSPLHAVPDKTEWRVGSSTCTCAATAAASDPVLHEAQALRAFKTGFWLFRINNIGQSYCSRSFDSKHQCSNWPVSHSHGKERLSGASDSLTRRLKRGPRDVFRRQKGGRGSTSKRERECCRTSSTTLPPAAVGRFP
jgi:hypothetical protein